MKIIYSLLGLIFISLLLNIKSLEEIESLVPKTRSEAPDYFCTWNLQGYTISNYNSKEMRKAMNEENLFGPGEYQNWPAKLYSEIREDLTFLLDDSWDIAQDNNEKPQDFKNDEFGNASLSITRFPSFDLGSNERNLKHLTNKIKGLGWKSLGLWVACQSPNSTGVFNTEHFTQRLKESNNAGVTYWKVDWGIKSRDEDFRKKLSTLAREVSPNVLIEHGTFQGLGNPSPQFISISDVARTYDVDNCIAQAQTIQRVVELLEYKVQNDDKGNTPKGIINCEDEPYIAVGLGCSIGVMRWGWAGKLPNGDINKAFPESGRDYNRRIDEVIRAVRWHRIAEPFGVNDDVKIGFEQEKDYWVKEKGDEGSKDKVNSPDCPMFVSRGMNLPTISESYNDQQPRILASKYPNGCYAVVTVGRQLEHTHVFNEVSVNIEVDNLENPIGIFGIYKQLTIKTQRKVNPIKCKVYAQDLKSLDSPDDITSKVILEEDNLVIPGSVINEIGLSLAKGGDKSDPGLVLLVKED